MKPTPPIGYDESGAPIEEVVSTATRLRPAWHVLLGLIGIAGAVMLGREISHELGMQRYTRARARRTARRARRR